MWAAALLAPAAAGVSMAAAAAPSPPSVQAPAVERPAVAIPAPSQAGGEMTARLVAPTPVRARPGGGRVRVHLRAETAWSHEPVTLLVLGSAQVRGVEWLRVLLPVRPSGSSGWIPANRTVLSADDLWLELDKASRRLSVFRAGRLLHRYPVVIGRADTPTPPGIAAIYERNRQPDPTGFLGPWALPLTALSPTLHGFEGGPGRIAIHGRDAESLADPLGTAASHGCIRIPDAAVRWLATHAPPGTPVQIH